MPTITMPALPPLPSTELHPSGSLHIAFDSQIFRRQRLGGISRYFADLATHLEMGGISVTSPRFSRQCWLWPSAWSNADVVHATFYGGYPYRLRTGQGLVSTLFDMIPERHPEHFFLPGLRSPHANKAAWLASSDLIISISGASADDLSFFLPTLRTRIKVIHLATSIHGVFPQQVPKLAARRYWLYVGKRSAYKNGLTLLRALALFRRHALTPGACPALVFAGGGPFSAEESRFIRSNGLQESVLQISANDARLAWLYRNAESVLVPSLAEGFSLPLIEALVCDTPVLASDIEVHREVANGFADFLSPLNARSWADWFLSYSSVPPQRPSVALGPEEYSRLCRYYSSSRLVVQHVDAYRDII